MAYEIPPHQGETELGGFIYKLPCPECGIELGGSRSLASHPGWGREGDLERLIKSHVESYCGAETSREIRRKKQRRQV